MCVCVCECMCVVCVCGCVCCRCMCAYVCACTVPLLLTPSSTVSPTLPSPTLPLSPPTVSSHHPPTLYSHYPPTLLSHYCPSHHLFTQTHTCTYIHLIAGSHIRTVNALSWLLPRGCLIRCPESHPIVSTSGQGRRSGPF